MKTCFKILGQGAQGITYLTPDNKVIKVEPSKKKVLSRGDIFGLEVVPTFNPDIRKHFMQIYSVEFYEYNPLLDLKCLTDNSIFRYFKKSSFENANLPIAKYYKVSIMENAGDKSASVVLKTAKDYHDLFTQLYIPICVMNYYGYFHEDLHMGNIMYSNSVYKIIDYGVMAKKGGSSLNYILYWILYYRTQYNATSITQLQRIVAPEEIDEMEVPKKYAHFANQYNIMYNLQEYVANLYYNEDTKVELVHTDKIFDDDTLLELAYLQDTETDYKKLAEKIQRLMITLI